MDGKYEPVFSEVFISKILFTVQIQLCLLVIQLCLLVIQLCLLVIQLCSFVIQLCPFVIQHSGWPVADIELCCNMGSNPDSLSISGSCFLPSER